MGSTLSDILGLSYEILYQGTLKIQQHCQLLRKTLVSLT